MDPMDLPLVAMRSKSKANFIRRMMGPVNYTVSISSVFHKQSLASHHLPSANRRLDVKGFALKDQPFPLFKCDEQLKKRTYGGAE